MVSGRRNKNRDRSIFVFVSFPNPKSAIFGMMVSTLQANERVLPYSYDISFNVRDHAYIFDFPVASPEIRRATTKYHSNNALPFDIKDILLSLLDSPRDLVSLALTSKEWASTIIPDYLYRDLNIRLNHGEIWKALSTRPELAQNTHTLRLLEPFPLPSKTTLMTLPQFSTGPTLDLILRDLSLALQNFTSLRKFCWTGSRRPLEISQSILEALGQCPALDEVDLGQVSLSQSDRRVTSTSSCWKFHRLTKLTLRGDWDRSGVDLLHLSLINNSPNLEELSILYGPASIHFTSCALPKLRKLHLWHDSLYIQFPESELYPYDIQIFNFLLSHPGIEDLRWLTWSWNRTSLPSGFLPSLKHLRAYGQLYRNLLQDHTLLQERKWESISRATLTSDIPVFEKLDLSRLKEMRLLSFEGFESLDRLAVLAPTIVTLAIPGFGPPPSINFSAYTYPATSVQPAPPTMANLHLEQYFNALSQFPLLETVLDSRLWPAIIRLEPEERVRAVSCLTTRCRRLLRVNYWDPLRHAEVDVIFTRNASEGGSVSWSETPSQEENWERFGGL